MKFHPDVLRCHEQFGGDLEEMQRNYDFPVVTPNEKPASPTQGELAVKALIELIDAPLTYDWNGHKDMQVQSIEQTDDHVAGRVRMLMRHDWNHEEICTLARDRIMGLSKRLAEVRAALSALARTTLPPAEGWRPMDSAPKDGSKFLAYEKGHYFDCWWHENGHGEAYWMDEADSEPNPSDWMKLPSAPQGSLP
ncbi:hypothetical protein LB579_30405 [Mesorhizobium sp. BR1-1-7]|uniref:hypothetical protein n=1 Tax=Mesorhizobium sp. BR1-1-7 TaxID=2876647 RepID=UPI001CCF83D0|nr:hypothetical protein [Mesorhizobium sp. BR1-1-7]MBZ9922006.1 hypothetical protein [Mesorhizobium sp. BR1-1-7]